MAQVGELGTGTVLRGKYRVERLIGQGGMGAVYEATHADLDRRVAIKVLHPELRGEPEIVERFLREGRAASKLESEHVARVLDVDRLDDGTPFLVLEYLEGDDLGVVRRSGSPLPISLAVGYVAQACSALADAHSHGVVHRDIKPANLFLARMRDGTTKIKLLDFGISKAAGVDRTDSGLTKTTFTFGSCEYMSPEQMLSAKDVDARTDIWALGVTLFELLTATVPFPGETVTAVCALVMTRQPPSLRSLRAGVPRALEAIVLRCLEKEREDRYPTAAQLERALRAFLSSYPGDRVVPPSVVRAADAYEVTDGQAIIGPVSLDQLRRGLAAGRLEHDARVRRVGGSEWSLATDVVASASPQVAASLDREPRTETALTAEPLPQRRSARRAVILATVAGIAAVAAVLVAVTVSRSDKDSTDNDSAVQPARSTHSTAALSSAASVPPAPTLGPTSSGPPMTSASSSPRPREIDISQLPDASAPVVASAAPSAREVVRTTPTVDAPAPKPQPTPPPTPKPTSGID